MSCHRLSMFLLILGPMLRHFILHEYLFSLTERNPKKTFTFTKKVKRKNSGEPPQRVCPGSREEGGQGIGDSAGSGSDARGQGGAETQVLLQQVSPPSLWGL